MLTQTQHKKGKHQKCATIASLDYVLIIFAERAVGFIQQLERFLRPRKRLFLFIELFGKCWYGKPATAKARQC